MDDEFITYWISWVAADTVTHLVAGPFVDLLSAQAELYKQGWKSERYQLVGQRIDVFQIES